MKKYSYLFILFILFSICTICTNSFAFSIRINEPKISLSVPAGGAKSATISVDNLTDEMISVRAYADDWHYAKQGDGTKEFFPRGTTDFSCSNWITTYPAEFELPPYGHKEVQFTIRVPQDAKGGYYSVIFFESGLGTAQTPEGVSVAVAGRLGSLIYLGVEGTVNKLAAVESLTISRKDKNSPAQINFIFVNTGNIDITAKGTYNIIDDKGMVYARGQVPDIYTTQGNEVNVNANFSSDLPSGNYDFILTLDLGADSSITEERRIQVKDSGLVQTLE